MNNTHGVHTVHKDSGWKTLRVIKSLTPPPTKAAFSSFHMPLYLIVASKTWTVESLSNETVLITNLTAFWNSDEFPIIFKQRNTNRYSSLKWQSSGDQPLPLWVCTACSSVPVKKDTQNVEGSHCSHHTPGQTASLPPTTHWRIPSPSGTTVWMNTPRIAVASSFHSLLPQALSWLLLARQNSF